jgi:alkyldihydroxyacetonephosphate synthase
VSAGQTGDRSSTAPPQLPDPGTRRKFWGWGREGEGLAVREIQQLGATFAGKLGIDGLCVQEPPRVDELELRAPRLAPPPSLEAAFNGGPYDRAAHAYGRSFRDLVRAFRRDFAHAPDLVAFPRDEGELVSVLEWRGGAGVAAIPFGGGSSVVGGVEPDVGDGYGGAVSVDLGRLAGVLEVDRTSLAARIAGGALGPALEAQLKPHGLTLRHFPQSFEWSTLGGWIATRSGRHFATLHTHIDEFVESVRVVTPCGVIETRRLPASGAGASVRFAGFADAVDAARELAQSGLHPANCRLLGHEEALLSGSGGGSRSILVLGFESADHELGPWLARARQICAGHRGEVREEDSDPPRSGVRRSCAARTCATLSPGSGWWSRRSRRRSPGIASGSSTRVCWLP